jgi:hypothetical protein
MEKPEYSPNFFGEMMKNCWLMDPKERPTFSQIAKVTCEYIESLFSFDYVSTNGEKSQNSLIEEIVDPTPNKLLANC